MLIRVTHLVDLGYLSCLQLLFPVADAQAIQVIDHELVHAVETLDVVAPVGLVELGHELIRVAEGLLELLTVYVDGSLFVS